MIKSVLSLLFSCLLCSGYCQQKLTVHYKSQYLTLTNKLDQDNNMLYRWTSYAGLDQYELTINDHLSAFRRSFTRNEYNGRSVHGDVPTGSMLAYTDVQAGYNYEPVNPLTKKFLMVKDSVSRLKWTFSSTVDTICGFACRKATSVTDHGYIFAWYAYELPRNFGPFFYTGLPGTVLCVEFSNSSTRYIADLVTDSSPEIVIPEARHIGADEYAAIMKEKRSYRGGFFGPKLDPYVTPRYSNTFATGRIRGW